MHEEDGGAAGAGTRGGVNDVNASCLQVVKSFVNIGHAQGDVRESAAAAIFFDLPGYRRIGGEGLEQLNRVGAVANAEEHFANQVLAVNVLAVNFGETHHFVGRDLIFQVALFYGDGHVIAKEKSGKFLSFYAHVKTTWPFLTLSPSFARASATQVSGEVLWLQWLAAWQQPFGEALSNRFSLALRLSRRCDAEHGKPKKFNKNQQDNNETFAQREPGVGESCISLLLLSESSQGPAVTYKKNYIASALLALLLGCWCFGAALAQNAPDGPGDLPTWTSGGKEGVGTATSTDSKVWFTLQNGILTEVYYPQLDTANVRTLEFAVSDGKRIWVESKDMAHQVERESDDALVYRQVSSFAEGKFKLTKTCVTDPKNNTLLIDFSFSGPTGYSVYVLFDPSLKNSGYGDTGYSQGDALVTEKESVAAALVGAPSFSEMTSGFVGTSDGYTDLLRNFTLTHKYARAEKGNVLQVAKLAHPAHTVVALGFGGNAAAALEAARNSLQRGFAAVSAEYADGWKEYVRGLVRVDARYERMFKLAAMVLKTHEDKTYRGAMIASMSIPWGFAVKAGEPTVGGYHLVWGRDLYEVATGLLVAGDREAAERALNYLFTVQQKSDGSYPQNSWLDGKPYWTALQMDEISYPLILAWQLGRTDADTWSKHVRPSAEFIISRGPATEEERWEEVSGYSPSTMAAEIAGLVCAADIARKNGAAEVADRYLHVADEWADNLEKWTVTTSGHLGKPGSTQGYYIRIDNTKDPNDGAKLDVKNGGGVWDKRDVVDAGFLELVRLGIRPASDPTIAHSVKIIDSTIRTETPNGPGFRRYNHDGYGETYFGGPWLGEGIGRLWPIFTGERGEYEIALGHDPALYLASMQRFANGGGMIPEQVWDQAAPTAYRFSFGEGTASATPLAWSMAQFLRLVICAQQKRIAEMPSVVSEHFLKSAKAATAVPASH
jgi:glucoamylase